MRSSKESSRFFTVEAEALPNVRQTLRGRERSKRGYALYLLLESDASGKGSARRAVVEHPIVRLTATPHAMALATLVGTITRAHRLQ